HDSKVETFLEGEGLRPFRVSPNSVDLQHPRRAANESAATVTLANPQSRNLILSVEAPPFVEAPDSVEIPAAGTAELTLRVAPEKLTGGEGKIVLSEQSDRAEIAVRVFPAPALLQTEPAETFALGRVEKNDSLRARFRILNQGGSTTEIQIETPSAVSLTSPRTLTLAPGQQQEITFAFQPATLGAYEDALHLLYDARKQSLALTAQVEAPGSLPASRPGEVSVPAPAAAPIGLSFQKLFVLEQGHDGVKLAWLKPSGEPPAAYRVDRRQLRRGERDEVQEVWEPLPNVSYGEEGNAHTAQISGLQAGQRLQIRIFSLEANGNITATSTAFSIATKAYAPRRPLPWLWAIPIGAVLAGLAWRIRGRRREARKRDLARLDEFTKA
ncbi:MAG TPA: hypothetical protein VIS74_04600, partial [Chthoniobacterales bacterium]